MLTFIVVLILGCVLAIAYSFSAKTNAQSASQVATSRIVVNQVGYYPNQPKTALLINLTNPPTGKVQLVNFRTKRTVFETEIETPKEDAESKDIIQTIDFSKFNKEGSYYLKSGEIKSYPFQIGKKIYREAFTKLLRSYYVQRCGVAVRDSVTGVNHPACHLNDGLMAHTDSFNQANQQKRATGGWHDAGDFGKYVGPTAVTIGRLLSLYEQYPQLFSDRQLAIPESGNRRPDILDEVKVGLDWMLTMQREDGAVYRKLSGKEWPGAILPHLDKQPRFVYGISTPETAKFAGAMAMANRIYASYDPLFAQACLNAAQKAWSFLQKEPLTKVDWVEGDENGSGAYLNQSPEGRLQTDRNDRLWAAAELFITTGNSAFEQYLAQSIASWSYRLFEWTDPSPVGMTNYLMLTGKKGSDSLKQQIKEKLIERADSLLEKVASNGYRLANQDFVWASNKRAAEEGITLLYAYRVTGDRTYFNAAVDQLDYLLGRNHFNKSFITAVGSNSVRNVHHRIAQARKIVIPGLMVGGPNANAEDGIAPKGLGPLSYLDDERSYATNEYAIDYNASVIGLMGMLMAEL
ncbi:MAG TPA: glycoside hydrolase family 9 protein [Coleofasciculaceae cyanobacterium]